MSTTHYIGYPCFGDETYDRIFEFPSDKLNHMIEIWNERVKHEDTVHVYGQFTDYENDHDGEALRLLYGMLNGKIIAHLYPEEMDFINKHLIYNGMTLEQITTDPILISNEKYKYTIEITPNNLTYNKSKNEGVVSININSNINDGFGPLSIDNIIEIKESFNNEWYIHSKTI